MRRPHFLCLRQRALSGHTVQTQHTISMHGSAEPSPVCPIILLPAAPPATTFLPSTQYLMTPDPAEHAHETDPVERQRMLDLGEHVKKGESRLASPFHNTRLHADMLDTYRGTRAHLAQKVPTP